MKNAFISALLILVIFALSSCASEHATKPKSYSYIPRTKAECKRKGGVWIFEGTMMLSKYCYLTKAQKATLRKQAQG